MALTAVISTAIAPSNYELIRDRIAEILGVEFTLQKVNNWIPANLCPKVCTERFIDIDESEFPVINVRLFRGTYLDENGAQTQDSSGHRIGTYTYYLDVYTGSGTSETAFGDEIATKNLQRIIGIAMAILEDTRYATLGFDPLTSGICNTHVEHFFIKEAGENENEIDYIRGRVAFVVEVPESVELPSPWALLMTTVTARVSADGETVYAETLQMQIIPPGDSNTLDNAFFSNPIQTIDLLDATGYTVTEYAVDTDFTLAGTTITATTFTFLGGSTYIFKT